MPWLGFLVGFLVGAVVSPLACIYIGSKALSALKGTWTTPPKRNGKPN